MKIRFWGVRGSIASPGRDTAAVGGNTSCVEVRVPGPRGDERIVLDAGTGLRALGNHLVASGAVASGQLASPTAMTLLLSHYHWDHIQGLPFFVPVYMKNTTLTIAGGKSGVASVRGTLERQMSAPVFPVQLDDVGARITTRELELGDTFDVGGAKVSIAHGNHPGGVVAYRIEHDGRSLVYATDTEHGPEVDPALRALAEGADVLVYDAQYLPSEYGAKVGWGHSTYVAGTDLARAAGVGRLVLFHHDPMRSDDGVAEIETNARSLFRASVAAREGMEIDLYTGSVGVAA